MRAFLARANGCGSKPSRGSKRSPVRRAFRTRSSLNVRSPLLVRSQVWTYQCGSSRWSVYGSTRRFDHVCSPCFWYSTSTSVWSLIACVNVAISCSSSSEKLGSGVWASSNWPNVSSSFARTRSRGVCACAAIIGPTNSSASRIARASSGVRRGGRRNVSPKSSLSTCTSSPCSSAYTA